MHYQTVIKVMTAILMQTKHAPGENIYIHG